MVYFINLFVSYMYVKKLSYNVYTCLPNIIMDKIHIMIWIQYYRQDAYENWYFYLLVGVWAL